MKIGGLQRFSLIEYPKKISCVVFTVGCNFRCSYCYNPKLVRETCQLIPEGSVFKFLEKRKGLLDAVVITGGEPLLQADIQEFCQKVKKRGFLAGLETNGAFPEKLKELIDKKLLDFVAMDVKAPLEKYSSIAKVEVATEKIKKSIQLIMKSKLEYEFRTTCYPALGKKDFLEIFKLIKGAKKYALQQFFSEKTLEKTNLKPYPNEFLCQLRDSAKKYVKEVDLRV